MIKLLTEDGYTFFLLENGTVVDNLDSDLVDLSFDTIAEFVEAMQS